MATHLNGSGRPAVTQNVGRAILREAESAKLERAFEFFLRAFNFPPPVKQFQFHPNRAFRADFAWPDINLLVEVEGGIWMRGGGAHSRPQGILRDIEKSNEAVRLGWRQIRVTGEMLGQNKWPQLYDLLRGFFV